MSEPDLRPRSCSDPRAPGVSPAATPHEGHQRRAPGARIGTARQRPVPDLLIELDAFSALTAFYSGAFGPLARVHEQHITLGNPIWRTPPLARPTLTDRTVALLEPSLGDDGAVLEATYAFPGSERDVVAPEAIQAGWLQASKARVLLLLATELPDSQVRAAFAAHEDLS